MPEVIWEKARGLLSLWDLARLPCVTAEWRKVGVTHLSLNLWPYRSFEYVVTGVSRLVDLNSIQTLLVEGKGSDDKIEFTLQVAQWVIDRARRLRSLTLRSDERSSLKHYIDRFQLDLSASSIDVLDTPATTLCFIAQWPSDVHHVETNIAPFCLLRDSWSTIDKFDDEVDEEDKTRLAEIRVFVCTFSAQSWFMTERFWWYSFPCDSRAMLKSMQTLEWCVNMERCEISLDFTTTSTNVETRAKVIGLLSRHATRVELRIDDRDLAAIQAHPNLALHAVKLTARQHRLSDDSDPLLSDLDSDLDGSDPLLWQQSCLSMSRFWRKNCQKLASRENLNSLHVDLAASRQDALDYSRYFEESFSHTANDDAIRWGFLRHLVLTQAPMIFLSSLMRDVPSLETLIVTEWIGESNESNEQEHQPKSRMVMPKLVKAVFPSQGRYARLLEAVDAPLLQELWLLGDFITTNAILPKVSRASLFLKKSSDKPREGLEFYGDGHQMDGFEGFRERNPHLPCVELVPHLDFFPRRMTSCTLTGARLFANEDIRQEHAALSVDPLLEQAVELLFDV